jgi:hypothetical protein
LTVLHYNLIYGIQDYLSFLPYVSSLSINDVLQEEQSDDAEILSPHGVFA